MSLCAHHVSVIAELRHLDHIGDSDADRAAENIARQCPRCVTQETT